MNTVNMEQEEWRPVVGYEGLYEVSNIGRVYSLRKGRLMKLGLKEGYPRVALFDSNNKSCSTLVHRLVAMAFIANPNGLETVNHIDFNKMNNKVENLEWLSRVDNLKHAIKDGRIGKPGVPRGKRPNLKCPSAKKVINVESGIVYASIMKAAKEIGVDNSHLSKCLSGSRVNYTPFRFLTT